MKYPASPPMIAAAAMLLAGCAGTASYPSLAPRTVEQAAAAAPAAPPPSAPDPAVSAKAAMLLAEGQSGGAAFDAAVRRGCAAIGRGSGAAEGGEAWVAAQQALSTVEAERGRTRQALAELDTLLVEQSRAAEDAPHPVDLSALTTAESSLSTLDAAQTARLDDLHATGCRS